VVLLSWGAAWWRGSSIRSFGPDGHPLLPHPFGLPLADVGVSAMFGVTVCIEEATMQFDSNIEFVEDLFAAFGRGDIDHFIDAHVVDAVTESPVSRTSTLPWAGVRRGRRELVEHFETIVAHVRPEAFQDVVFTASGDRVVAEGSNAGTVLATGERYEHDWVMVFTIRDGKVVRFRHFYDPGDIKVAMSE
jgi:ketosteroid isomerase-like protein